MLEQLLEKNKSFLKGQKAYRSFSGELESLVNILNHKKVVLVSGLRYTGKSSFMSDFLSKTQSLEKAFYFNKELDSYTSIKNSGDLSILFELHTRSHKKTSIIILHNTHDIPGIKSFISDIITQGKYKLIIAGNNIKVSGIDEITLYPLPVSPNSFEKKDTGGLPCVRVLPDKDYAYFLLENLYKNLVLEDLVIAYNIKNIELLFGVLSFIGENDIYFSQRELHRELKSHNIDISLLTLIDYLNAAVNTKLLHKCHSYDIKSQKVISTKVCYFFGDVGLRNVASSRCINTTLRNILYLDFLSKGYHVYGGKNGKFEFDFYAKNENGEETCIALEDSLDKGEIRKTARKLAKIGELSQKYVIIPHKDIDSMKKFEESGVEILTFEEYMSKK